MQQQLKKEVLDTLIELTNFFASVDAQFVNIVPFEGSWTAGQLAQHMILSNGGFAEMMSGPSQDTQRKPDEKVEMIRSTFLDFSRKLKSPDFIQPPNIHYQKDDLLKKLAVIQKNLDQAMDSSDLNKTCTLFELPVLGALTRLEAAHFIVCHTQRHIHQLKNILSQLRSTNLEVPLEI